MTRTREVYLDTREFDYYELILLGLGNNPERLFAFLRNYFHRMSEEEIHEILAHLPTRLQIVGMSAQDRRQHYLIKLLQETGTVVELREYISPFLVNKASFLHLLSGHPEMREIYRFTYLPTFHD